MSEKKLMESVMERTQRLITMNSIYGATKKDYRGTMLTKENDNLDKNTVKIQVSSMYGEVGCQKK